MAACSKYPRPRRRMQRHRQQQRHQQPRQRLRRQSLPPLATPIRRALLRSARTEPIRSPSLTPGRARGMAASRIGWRAVNSIAAGAAVRRGPLPRSMSPGDTGDGKDCRPFTCVTEASDSATHWPAVAAGQVRWDAAHRLEPAGARAPGRSSEKAPAPAFFRVPDPRKPRENLQ